MTEELKLIRAYLSHALYPKFKNMSLIKAKQSMMYKKQGDFIVRSSSKGLIHVAVTWKVTNKICQHVDIRKENLDDDFYLCIDDETYHDLDDVIERYIKPMAKYARQLLDHKNYKDIECNLKKSAEKFLGDHPDLSYVICATKDYLGKFLISYTYKKSYQHNYITVTRYGFYYKDNNCGSIEDLDMWIRNSMDL